MLDPAKSLLVEPRGTFVAMPSRRRSCWVRPGPGHGRRGGGRGGAGTRGTDAAGPARRPDVDIQFRRQCGHVRLCGFPLHGPEARAAIRRPQRQLVRGVGEACTGRGVLDFQLFTGLRKIQRGRDAHLRRRADAGRRRCILVRHRGRLYRLAFRQQPRRPRRERARLHRGPHAVHAGPRDGAV